eukprot:754766-Hanusia_phi.AAC.2
MEKEMTVSTPRRAKQMAAHRGAPNDLRMLDFHLASRGHKRATVQDTSYLNSLPALSAFKTKLKDPSSNVVFPFLVPFLTLCHHAYLLALYVLVPSCFGSFSTPQEAQTAFLHKTFSVHNNTAFKTDPTPLPASCRSLPCSCSSPPRLLLLSYPSSASSLSSARAASLPPFLQGYPPLISSLLLTQAKTLLFFVRYIRYFKTYQAIAAVKTVSLLHLDTDPDRPGDRSL